MTEQVKFPGTDVEAPQSIMAYKGHSSTSIVHCNDWTHKRESEDQSFGLEYYRADTVALNDQLENMLIEAYEAGFCRAAYHNQCSSSLARKKAIDEIRSRYASSDSD